MESSNLNNLNIINSIVTDIILTPFTCSALVNEILKGILYQKCQIPYPYNWMKIMVTRKREKMDKDKDTCSNFKATNHFRMVSSVFDTIETAMVAISKEFSQQSMVITEILFVLGTTPHTANEVLSVSFSTIVEGHKEKNHVVQLNKYLQKNLRSIFLSQSWVDKIDGSVSCTNCYIYIVKKEIKLDTAPNDTSSDFIQSTPVTFSPKTKFLNISLCSDCTQDTTCCGNFSVFEEETTSVLSENCDFKDPQENLRWYRFKGLIKGFKDCFINKKSVTELW